MTLDEFITNLRSLHGRGAAFDAEAKVFFKQAYRYVERRISLNHMYHFNTFQLDPESQYPRTINLGGQHVKSVDLVRIILPDGSFHNLEKVDAGDIDSVPEGIPSRFWLTQNRLIVLDAAPAEPYEVEIAWYAYTSVGEDANWTDVLLESFEDGLTYRTMFLIGHRFRDINLIQTYNTLFEDAFTTLVMAAEEAENLTSSPRIGYVSYN